MVNPTREALHGIVQVDETYLGGIRIGMSGGRNVDEKTVVVGAVEVRLSEGESEKGKKSKVPHLYAGLVLLRAVPDATAKTLLAFVTDHVPPSTNAEE
jgi:hypothetical protein